MPSTMATRCWKTPRSVPFGLLRLRPWPTSMTTMSRKRPLLLGPNRRQLIRKTISGTHWKAGIGNHPATAETVRSGVHAGRNLGVTALTVPHPIGDAPAVAAPIEIAVAVIFPHVMKRLPPPHRPAPPRRIGPRAIDLAAMTLPLLEIGAHEQKHPHPPRQMSAERNVRGDVMTLAAEMNRAEVIARPAKRVHLETNVPLVPPTLRGPATPRSRNQFSSPTTAASQTTCLTVWERKNRLASLRHIATKPLAMPMMSVTSCLPFRSQLMIFWTEMPK